ncbi:MAG: hypothetical protein IJG41_01980 [Bacteroidales bacterium]|nr:hypothetical protein [Bacteroidales bacterium]
MKNIRLYITLMFVAVLTSSSMAQLSPVDFMRNNPRATFANPATYTVDNGYFDLAIGGINFGLINSGLKYDKFFKFDGNGYPTTLDLDKGIASLQNVNYLNTYLNFDIFNCGLRTKHGYFTYTHRLRETESLSFTKDLLQLIAQGNASFLGDSNPVNIELSVAARVYQEFDFGYQMALTDHLDIGIRAKFLMGFADVKANALSAKLYTDPDTYAMKLALDPITVRGTFPYQFQIGDDYALSIVDRRFNPANLFRNYGFGFDLGAAYQINDEWGVAAAINDLGLISWNNYSVEFKAEVQDGGSFYEDGSIVFPGLNSDQLHGLLFDSTYVNNLMDSLSGYYQLSVNPLARYNTGLNTNFMVRGYYNITPEHRFTAQFSGYNCGLGIKPALTLAYTGSFGGKYDVVATYTIMNGRFDNLGVGLSANFGGILLYVASNNIIGFFNPANSSQLNVQLGISFTSGESTSRSEKVIIKAKEAEKEE